MRLNRVFSDCVAELSFTNVIKLLTTGQRLI